MISDDALSDVFAALADPVRRAIVVRLYQGDATVNDLAAPFDMSLQAVSKHLKVLEHAGLITRRREAQRRWCHLNHDVLAQTSFWLEQYREAKEEQYQKLETVLRKYYGEEQS